MQRVWDTPGSTRLQKARSSITPKANVSRCAQVNYTSPSAQVPARHPTRSRSTRSRLLVSATITLVAPGSPLSQPSSTMSPQGDLFSSGEGVPPFISGTDTSTNGCHRSTQAYAMLLDQDPALNLNLQSFRACSGATTQTMVSGQGDNGNQLDAITADTDVVTLTVGGNNVEFATFVENCLTPGTVVAPKVPSRTTSSCNGLTSCCLVTLPRCSDRSRRN